ncbi:hypothetical protein BSIN_4869 [Burkholderia singularis]|uniref:Uncharacterized protein n=1 Tax=Burkholderia singularis TaxID=1503053 RepID=A0A238H9V5_9BURK|nr:hypothetical protein BSIN_4869 [Burkholderia singularis]
MFLHEGHEGAAGEKAKAMAVVHATAIRSITIMFMLVGTAYPVAVTGDYAMRVR